MLGYPADSIIANSFEKRRMEISRRKKNESYALRRTAVWAVLERDDDGGPVCRRQELVPDTAYAVRLSRFASLADTVQTFVA